MTVPKKGGVEFVLDSNLQGVVSSLPDPLNKSAAAPALPLRDQRAAGWQRGVGTTLEAVGRSVFQAQFQRRFEGGKAIITRGGIALNEPVRLADKGVLVAANADRPRCRRLAQGAGGNPSGSSARPTRRAPATRAFRFPGWRCGPANCASSVSVSTM